MTDTRNTPQKRAVAEALKLLHNHPTADTVYDYIHPNYPSVSKATVYRILKQMASEGTALHIPVPDGADRFDDTLFPHHHIRCTVCGSVDDLMIPDAFVPQLSPELSGGYAVVGYTLLFRGICPACQNRKDR